MKEKTTAEGVCEKRHLLYDRFMPHDMQHRFMRQEMLSAYPPDGDAVDEPMRSSLHQMAANGGKKKNSPRGRFAKSKSKNRGETGIKIRPSPSRDDSVGGDTFSNCQN